MDDAAILVDVPERLQTARLVLRVPRAGDGPAFNEAVVDTLAELAPWMPWAQQAPSADDSEAYVRRAHARFLLRRDLSYGLWAHDGSGREGRLVGAGGLHRMDWQVPRFEIGYWRRRGAGGRGFVTEAVQALARMAFDRLRAQRVEIRMDDRNTASARVAERAGFRLEGVLRRDSLGIDGTPRDTRVYARVRGAEEPSVEDAGSSG